MLKGQCHEIFETFFDQKTPPEPQMSRQAGGFAKFFVFACSKIESYKQIKNGWRSRDTLKYLLSIKKNTQRGPCEWHTRRSGGRHTQHSQQCSVANQDPARLNLITQILIWIRHFIGLFRKQTEIARCKLRVVQDRAEQSWMLFRTALSRAECCLAQRWVKMIAVLDTAESSKIAYSKQHADFVVFCV